MAAQTNRRLLQPGILYHYYNIITNISCLLNIFLIFHFLSDECPIIRSGADLTARIIKSQNCREHAAYLTHPVHRPYSLSGFSALYQLRHLHGNNPHPRIRLLTVSRS